MSVTPGAVLNQVLRDARIRAELPPPHLARALREQVGLTQRDVARAMGVSVGVVNRWEKQRRAPGRATRLKYSLLLQRLADELPTWPAGDGLAGEKEVTASR